MSSRVILLCMRGGQGSAWEPARRFQALQERLAGLLITEASGDRTIKVTVSANGVLTNLELGERWRPVPLPAVAAEIMDCVRRAQARIPELLRQAIADTVGETDPSAALLLTEAQRRFPEAVPAQQTEPRPAQRAEPRPVQQTEPRPAQRAEPRPARKPRATDLDDADDWAEPEIFQKD